jgi:deoxycytidine triphosphate deaminase
MTSLSDQDIKRELGKNILIYPFKRENLKNASYNLTASKLAWSLQTKESIYSQDESDHEMPGKIIIKPQTTALIETHETIWVNSKICGTYHSKVSWVSKGLGHIATTLDPEYIGPSLITVHNHSNISIEIIPEQDTFASLMFFYLKTRSSCQDNNRPGRPEILKDFKVTPEQSQWFELPYRKYVIPLRKKLRKSLEYQTFKKGWFSYFLWSFIFGLLFCLVCILYFLIAHFKSDPKEQGDYKLFLDTLAFIKTPLLTAFLVQLVNNFNKYNDEVQIENEK